MLGINLLVRAGRSLLAGPVADAGWLPAGYYRHLVLEALEEDDFPGALNYLKWTDAPLLAQLLILRVRLLAKEHQEQRETLRSLLSNGLPEERREKCRALLEKQERALELLTEYEGRALRSIQKKT
ncbi:MAG: hypothetical protein A2Z73_04495 [Deltaproteobacteria bacterium RBG_13_60_28]|nr:MAG: hypothetical protein A2Z73_04495 [Deltaproteobacteria bacterium RBG_13_60_28]